MREFECLDCKVNTLDIGEYYMVSDYVWKKLASLKQDDGMLCIGCLEARIGRTLTKRDFTDCLLNHSGNYGQSERLQLRLAQ